MRLRNGRQDDRCASCDKEERSHFAGSGTSPLYRRVHDTPGRAFAWRLNSGPRLPNLCLQRPNVRIDGMTGCAPTSAALAAASFRRYLLPSPLARNSPASSRKGAASSTRSRSGSYSKNPNRRWAGYWIAVARPSVRSPLGKRLRCAQRSCPWAHLSSKPRSGVPT
jgi:hypothetical protein